jgi:4a-hydroxytetrahydrobiopterin dehydratase
MTTPLSDAEIVQRLATVQGWVRDGDSLKKQFHLENYLAGLALATAIGTICEGLDHHPTMVIGWRKVEVTLITHDAGNKLSHKDFDAAERIDALGFPPAN